MRIGFDYLIENAATASQNLALLGDHVLREAIKMNIYYPLYERLMIAEAQSYSTGRR